MAAFQTLLRRSALVSMTKAFLTVSRGCFARRQPWPETANARTAFSSKSAQLRPRLDFQYESGMSDEIAMRDYRRIPPR